MVLMARGTAIEAKGVNVTVKAEHVTLASGGVAMEAADSEEGSGEEGFKPRRHRHCLISYKSTRMNIHVRLRNPRSES